MAAHGKIVIQPFGEKFAVVCIAYAPIVTYRKEFLTKEEAEADVKRLKAEMRKKQKEARA